MSDEEDAWNDMKLSIGEVSEIIKSTNCKKCKTVQELFIVSEGDIVCPGCGFIQESHIISDDPEWNNYVEDGVMNSSGMRCGTVLDPTNPSSLSTSGV